MAAPNLRSPTIITGKTSVYPVTATLGSALSNAAASGKVLKVNSIRGSNVDGTNAATLSVTLYRSTVDTHLIKAVEIKPQASLVVLNREEQMYLEEGDDIRAVASAAGDIELTISYEEVS
jgi:hypothetical protein